jgi:hypothetical protein
MTGQGCDAEVATVSMRGRTAWTFAFAAFGPIDSHRSLLERAWDTVVSGRPRPRRLQLRCEDSCGYPEWIANIESSNVTRRGIRNLSELRPGVAG